MTPAVCCHGTRECDGQGDKHWCRVSGQPSREGLTVQLEILTKENEALRSALARSERERAAYLEALTETQARCTELREELRKRT